MVVLAAGESKRFGSQKLLHRLEASDTLFERALRACGTFDTLVVCNQATLPVAQTLHACAILNPEPERGMAHSLRLADAAIDAERPILVLPADLLLIEPHHVVGIAALANDHDVVYPVRPDGTPGHPVYFSPRARARVSKLRDNEPIAHLRDDPELRQRAVAVEESWPYQDVDRPGDL